MPDLMSDNVSEEDTVAQAAIPRLILCRIDEHGNVSPTFGSHRSVPQLFALNCELWVQNPKCEMVRAKWTVAAVSACWGSSPVTLDKAGGNSRRAENSGRVCFHVSASGSRKVNVHQEPNRQVVGIGVAVFREGRNEGNSQAERAKKIPFHGPIVGRTCWNLHSRLRKLRSRVVYAISPCKQLNNGQFWS